VTGTVFLPSIVTRWPRAHLRTRKILSSYRTSEGTVTWKCWGLL